MKTISLMGKLRRGVVFFNANIAEVTLLGDFVYNKKYFKNLPVLRLLIEDIGIEGDPDVMVIDEYCNAIPYLKPNRIFREILKEELQSFQQGLDKVTSKLIYLGLIHYLRQLESFSEIKTLVREVKGQVNGLKPEKAKAEDMRRILEILGRTSAIDNQFEFIKTEVSK